MVNRLWNRVGSMAFARNSTCPSAKAAPKPPGWALPSPASGCCGVALPVVGLGPGHGPIVVRLDHHDRIRRAIGDLGQFRLRALEHQPLAEDGQIVGRARRGLAAGIAVDRGIWAISFLLCSLSQGSSRWNCWYSLARSKYGRIAPANSRAACPACRRWPAAETCCVHCDCASPGRSA